MSKNWATSGLDLLLSPDVSAGRRSGVEHSLRDAIRSGRLMPGARVPSTRTLAGQLGVSRGTVTAAYQQLAAEGYLTARHGSGTTVADVARQSACALPSVPGADVPRHDLRPGRPDLSAFPAAAWLRAARRVLTAAPGEVYALSDPCGRIELRTALAEYLGRTRGVPASPDQIVITCGYSQALGLLARVLADAGTTAVAMEEPGHPFHRGIVQRAGLQVVPLPVDERGARTDLLAAAGTELASTDLAGAGLAGADLAGAGLAAAGAVVLTPAHQYPTGATLHPERRHAVTRWARATGALIIEDDFDGEFRYDRNPVGAVHGMAPDHIAYVGTASKTLAPALRLAWVVLPGHLIEPVTEAKRYADSHTETLGQLILADLITSHAYDRHVRASRLRYRHRRDLLTACLRRRAPHVEVRGVAAGLHALIRLPVGLGESDVLARATAHGLAVQPMADHWHRPGDRPQGIIVGYSAPAEHGYPAALDALCAVLSSRPGHEPATPAP